MWAFLPYLSLCLSLETYYSASNIIYNPSSISAILTFQGQSQPSTIHNLNLTILAESYNHARVRITDLNNTRWEVPDIILNPSSSILFSEANYSITLLQNPFGLSIYRKSNNQLIFNIDPNVTFQYQNQDLIMTSLLDYPFYVYGIGERVSHFPLNPGIYTLFARGQPGPYDNGKPPGKNMYSSQPVHIAIDSLGNTHGGFLLNSNAMDITIHNYSITYRPIGGIIDYFSFVGPKPEDVVKQYQKLVGFPVLIPYWTLGYHQSRWGYHNLSDLENVVTNFNKYQIPLDVLWTDIDYMTNFEDFTLDPERYNYENFSIFIENLHSANRKFVPICDAAIPILDYPPYNLALEQNLLIGSPHHNGPLVGKVWPGFAVFLDWFNPNATGYWHSMMNGLRKLVDFDGFWIDMNDPSNFCEGECGYPASQFVKDLPYVPGYLSLNLLTIDLAATHIGGLIEFDVHNLYGFKMALASSKYFTDVLKTRPFILSRSSFPGQGRFASKWLGDNFSLYDWMAYSIPGIFNFQIFGIPLIGADICGFSFDTTEDLCCRWYQLGTMYPFTRNHNSNNTIPQEPWAFGPLLLAVSNQAIRNKYSLMNYYYTHMFFLSVKGGAFFKPTFFEYPTDVRLQYDHAEKNFMVGPALLVHPALIRDITIVEAYFPADIWYNWYTGKRISTPFNRTLTLDAPLNGTINIHIRGGQIVTKNDASETANTVYDLRYGNITLVIGINGEGFAKGSMVLDDGVSLGTIENGNYTEIDYVYSENGKVAYLDFVVKNSGYNKTQGEWPFVSTLVLYGCISPIRSVFNGQNQVDYSLAYSSRLQVATAKLSSIQPDVPYKLQINF